MAFMQVWPLRIEMKKKQQLVANVAELLDEALDRSAKRYAGCQKPSARRKALALDLAGAAMRAGNIALVAPV